MTSPVTKLRLEPPCDWPRSDGESSLLGFTLLELVVVIAVLGVLAAAVAPAVVQRIMADRVDDTRAEAQLLHEAIVGRPGEHSFGFVGDIGRLPRVFEELAHASGLSSYTTGTIRNVGVGWRGPYANTGRSTNDYLSDAFGRAYTGAASGQVRSGGPDGIAGNTDDIVYPPAAPVITGTVSVTVKTIIDGKTIVDPSGYRVDLYYALNGAQASLSDTAAAFSFTNVPMGLHAVRVVKTTNPGSGEVVAEDTLTVRPGSAIAAELWF